MNRRMLSRRRFLRGTVAGAAVSLSLPALEAMFDSRRSTAEAKGPEPLFGVFFWGNGVPWHGLHTSEAAEHPDLWTPSTTGPGYTPSELLAPLSRHQVTVASGLEPKTEIPSLPPGQSDGHMRGFMVALTGDRPRSEGFDHPSHTLTALRPSIDQVVARDPLFYTSPPRYRSLQLGVSTARFHEYGHWNAISYNGPDSVNPPVMHPGDLYDRLFAAPGSLADAGRRVRALDAVLDDAKGLRQQLGVGDRARLDAHLQHLFEIQRRLKPGETSCTVPPRPASETDLHKKTSMLAELLALALSCGLSRVFSFMLTAPATTHIFRNLGVADDMHKVCHDGRWQEIRRITLYQMQAFALLLDELAKVRLPTGKTLLDAACILGVSEYGEGWKHSVRELPVVLAGGANGRLRRGVHVREPGGNLCKAQLTALRALGLPVDRFGWNGAETTRALDGVLL
ncbi:MAG: DUF1552 domain-containing protein [Myxococcales bacterium]|nr:DUF1552 domain-containing protein [Myxococcales bacterium]